MLFATAVLNTFFVQQDRQQPEAVQPVQAPMQPPAVSPPVVPYRNPAVVDQQNDIVAGILKSVFK